MTTNRVLLDGLVFPEGVRWHDDKLWVADQHAHKVWTCDLDGKAEVVAELEDMPSGLGFLPDGTPLVTEMRTQRVFRIRNGGLELHADFNSLRPGWINDMVVDGKGRAYVGQRQGKYAQANEGPESVVLVEPDGRYRVVVDDIQGPNGTIVTPDNRVMIITEGGLRQLTAFDIEEDGSLVNRRVWAGNVRSDGICLDAEGAVWVGSPQEHQFMRVREGGEIADRIEVDGWAIACVLGGPDRRTLFMLCTHTNIESIRRLGDPGLDHTSDSRGRVEMVQVDVPGAGWP